MATIILAVGDRALKRICQDALAQAGHTSVAIERPLELLSLDARVKGDVMFLDDSALGADALRAGGIDFAGRLVGLGFDSAQLQPP